MPLVVTIGGFLGKFLAWLCPNLAEFSQPQPISLLFKGFSEMRLDYDILLPNPTKPNVVTQVVTYTVTTGGVAGAPVVVSVDLTANPVVVPKVSLLPNDEFDGSVVQVDASGNKSEPSPNFKFVAVDNQPPSVPDSLALKFVGYSA